MNSAPPIAWSVILTLVAVTLTSLVMFAILVRRNTTRRQWVSLNEWARQRGMRREKLESSRALPAPLDALADKNARARLQISGQNIKVVQFDLGASESGPWNVMIRKLTAGRSYVPTALRPSSVSPGQSAIDLFGLTPFHSLANSRFDVLGIEARAANRVADSSARALLPQDIGLLLHGDTMLLDFSARPFDPVELDRMLSVSEQIAAIC